MSAREISFPRNIPQRSEAGRQIPCAVIVGRPNVGKSALLNCLARQRISIVEPTAGVTRDRISIVIEHDGRLFELWDTGGIGTTDDLAEEVQYQIEMVLGRADLVLFVVDAQEGCTALDESITKRLRKVGRDVLLVANKVDHATHEVQAAEFHRLGFGEPATISAIHGHGRTNLLDRLVAALPESHETPEEPAMKLALIGRQNVGKSTLINTLAREKRVIVSEIPGTTRDAVDVRFERRGRTFIAVDTAGLKRKSRLKDSVEFYSLTRAQHAIRRCDVVLFMVDVTADIAKVDKQLAGALEKETKPCVITVNKWDLAAERITPDAYVAYLNAHLPALAYAPVTFISAMTSENLDATLELAESLFVQAQQQIATSEINRALREAVQMHKPAVRHGKQPRLFYGTQIACGPPTFLIFCSEPQLITSQYTRYLQSWFREHLSIPDIPIRLVFRRRPRRGDEQEMA